MYVSVFYLYVFAGITVSSTVAWDYKMLWQRNDQEVMLNVIEECKLMLHCQVSNVWQPSLFCCFVSLLHGGGHQGSIQLCFLVCFLQGVNVILDIWIPSSCSIF